MCRRKSPAGNTSKSLGTIRFNAPNLSYIPLVTYLKRIALLFDCSNECFVIALEYIHRLVTVRRELEVNYSTVHQLIVAAIRVSHKFFDDNVVRSSYYAHIVDLPANTISVFEAQLLFFFNFDLNVRPDQYYKRYTAMLEDNRNPTKVTI